MSENGATEQAVESGAAPAEPAASPAGEAEQIAQTAKFQQQLRQERTRTAAAEKRAKEASERTKALDLVDRYRAGKATAKEVATALQINQQDFYDGWTRDLIDEQSGKAEAGGDAIKRRLDAIEQSQNERFEHIDKTEKERRLTAFKGKMFAEVKAKGGEFEFTAMRPDENEDLVYDLADARAREKQEAGELPSTLTEDQARELYIEAAQAVEKDE